MNISRLLLAACTLPLFACMTVSAKDSHIIDRSTYKALATKEKVIIDGIADESTWSEDQWRSIDNRWLGPAYEKQDFSGRYQISWDENRIYLLVEITDDILIDTHRDPLIQYWDDDCLEIFIDENFSGGNHQYNHNAFAYHLSLDNRAIDIGTDKQAREYTDHVESKWRQEKDKLIWEVAIEVYTDAYKDDSNTNVPIKLDAGKVLGLMLAYCDNDGSELRENFIGSESIPFGPKDRGWIDANVFGKLILVE